MKKLVVGFLFLAAMASTSLYAGDKKGTKSEKKCMKTEAGCCKKGEKASSCCMDKQKQAAKKS